MSLTFYFAPMSTASTVQLSLAELGVPYEAVQVDLQDPAGDLVITEIMADPKSVADDKGEWFEVYNASAKTLELKGVVPPPTT